MKKTIAYLGLDVHKKSNQAALLPFNSSKVTLEKKLPGSIYKVVKFAKELNKEYDLRICYEAGCTGFGLYRKLVKAGLQCTVIAPSSLPKKQRRVKTDKIDAKKLAQYFKSNILRPVNVPDVSLEEDRDLLRFREAQVKNMTRVKQQIKAFLLRKSIDYDHEKTWNKSFFNWLGTVKLSSRDRQNLNRYLSHLNYEIKLIEELNTEISRLAQSDKYRDYIVILCGFRGIDVMTAMTIVTNIPDFRSFTHPKYLSSYIGVTPGSNDSGESKRSLGITKAGNRMLRKAFVSAAQHYSSPNKTGAKLSKQREPLASSIRAIVERCDRKCRKLYWKLILNLKKETNVAKTAVAREMVHFVWEAMMEYHQGEIREIA